MSETSDNIAPQSREILQTFVWWWAQTCPPPPPAHHTNVYKLLRLCRATYLLAFILSLSNLATLLILRRPLQQWRWIFANWSMCKVEKTVEGSIYDSCPFASLCNKGGKDSVVSPLQVAVETWVVCIN